MMLAETIDPAMLQAILARHLTMYRTKVPIYQVTMLNSLLQVWLGNHHSLVDVGAGTGVIAEAISALFPVDRVRAVDVVDRFCRSLSVPTQTYDGQTLPFGDQEFDAATLNNVIHHVPAKARTDFLREIRRVVSGSLYIKDHETRGKADDIRLTVLDAIGNIPFGGMIRASYLNRSEWEGLAKNSGYRIAARAELQPYRSGALATLFPNRLEVTMRLDRV